MILFNSESQIGWSINAQIHMCVYICVKYIYVHIFGKLQRLKPLILATVFKSAHWQQETKEYVQNWTSTKVLWNNGERPD